MRKTHLHRTTSLNEGLQFNTLEYQELWFSGNVHVLRPKQGVGRMTETVCLFRCLLQVSHHKAPSAYILSEQVPRALFCLSKA